GSYIMLVHLRPLCGSRGAVGRAAGRPPGSAEDLNLHSVSAVMAKGKHPVPFRTRKLSPSAPMVLRGGPRGRVGRRRTTSLGVASLKRPPVFAVTLHVVMVSAQPTSPEGGNAMGDQSRRRDGGTS